MNKGQQLFAFSKFIRSEEQMDRLKNLGEELRSCKNPTRWASILTDASSLFGVDLPPSKLIDFMKRTSFSPAEHITAATTSSHFTTSDDDFIVADPSLEDGSDCEALEYETFDALNGDYSNGLFCVGGDVGCADVGGVGVGTNNNNNNSKKDNSNIINNNNSNIKNNNSNNNNNNDNKINYTNIEELLSSVRRQIWAGIQLGMRLDVLEGEALISLMSDRKNTKIPMETALRFIKEQSEELRGANDGFGDVFDGFDVNVDDGDGDSIVEVDVYDDNDNASIDTEAETETETERKNIKVAELAKANAIKEKLERLCRDLHHENRRLREDSLRREDEHNDLVNDLLKLKEADYDYDGGVVSGGVISGGAGTSDEEKTTTNTTTFCLGPISHKTIEEYYENGSLGHKYLSLVDLYNLRETHFISLLRGRDVRLLALKERILLTKKKEIGLTTAVEALQTRIKKSISKEVQLEDQVRQYVDKFRQVEQTLSKSNELFSTFRKEMEEMALKVKRLERDNASLLAKSHNLSRNIVEMAEERSKLLKEYDGVMEKKKGIEALCRRLERELKAARSS